MKTRKLTEQELREWGETMDRQTWLSKTVKDGKIKCFHNNMIFQDGVGCQCLDCGKYWEEPEIKALNRALNKTKD